MTEGPHILEIRGGAGPAEVAAVMAAVQAALAEEAALQGAPTSRFVPGPWVLAGRPRSPQPPLRQPARGPLDWLPADQGGVEEL